MHHYVDKKVEPPEADLYLDDFGPTLTHANWMQKSSFPTITFLTGGKKQPSNYNFLTGGKKEPSNYNYFNCGRISKSQTRTHELNFFQSLSHTSTK